MYIAHPTHGAGTGPNRTQLKTAARKTTLNAGQCVCQPREGRGRNRQAPPPKKNKKKGGGRGKRSENSPQPPNRPPTPPEAAKPPPQKAPKTGPPKRHRGTTHPKPATPGQEQRPTGKRDTETKTKKKREPPAQPERKGMEGQGPQSPRQEKKSAKNTPRQPSQEGLRTAETRAQHTRPHRTPEPETAGGQAGRPRNHKRPISRPKPKPNQEHHKQPTLEGQRHKPCPNTPTQDPSQDWRG